MRASIDVNAPISRRRGSTYASSRSVTIIDVIRIAIGVGFVFVIIVLFASRQISTSQAEQHPVEAAINKPRKSLRRPEDINKGRNGLLVHTSLGTIKIHFTPQLSGKTSIDYVINVAQNSAKPNDPSHNSCDRCNLYRAEPNLLLQGVLDHRADKSKVTLGPCPVVDWKPNTPCPAHDPNCGCHGPIMTRGEQSFFPYFLCQCFMD
jgi:hypothetical protein